MAEGGRAKEPERDVRSSLNVSRSHADPLSDGEIELKDSVPSASGAFTLPEDKHQILGLAVNTLGRNVVWALAQRTAQHGVMPGAYPIIAWLMQRPNLTQGELTRMVGIEQPTMALTLRRMERDGLIKRTPDPQHGRRSLISLTERGVGLSEIVKEAARQVEEVAVEGLTPEEVLQFFRLAAVMISNLIGQRHR